jgi:hypothetical protein
MRRPPARSRGTLARRPGRTRAFPIARSLPPPRTCPASARHCPRAWESGVRGGRARWIPACAGMTAMGGVDAPAPRRQRCLSTQSPGVSRLRASFPRSRESMVRGEGHDEFAVRGHDGHGGRGCPGSARLPPLPVHAVARASPASVRHSRVRGNPWFEEKGTMNFPSAGMTAMGAADAPAPRVCPRCRSMRSPDVSRFLTLFPRPRE